jgi:uncharacterized tellurite resistance protein B-like protein
LVADQWFVDSLFLPLDFDHPTCNVAPSTTHGNTDMFEAFRKFLSDVSEGGKHPTHFEHGDYRLAAAALLVHTAAIDGNVSELERVKLHAVIKRQFGLDEATTDELVAEATEAEHDAIDLYHFTSLINRSLDEDGRRRVVEMMWEIIYADGRVTEFESNLVWRAADLLGISSRERIELGQRVAAQRGTDPT